MCHEEEYRPGSDHLCGRSRPSRWDGDGDAVLKQGDVLCESPPKGSRWNLVGVFVRYLMSIEFPPKRIHVESLD